MHTLPRRHGGNGPAVPRILIVGAGYAGFYVARGLERALRPGQAELVVVDPRPYMTYQPFLPEVCAGSVEARHAAVSLRAHLRRTQIIDGRLVRLDHAHRRALVATTAGPSLEVDYDVVVVTAGAVTRTMPVPGLDEVAIGMKHVEEAVAIRDRLITSFDRAATLPPGPQRRRLLTVAFVGGGFSGVEGFGELLSLAHDLLERYPEIDSGELGFHLVDANDRILPEVDAKTARWVADGLRARGAQLHLGARLTSAEHGHLQLSTGAELDVNLLVWTAGNGANPVIATNTDLPVDARGRLIVRPDLRVGTLGHPVADAWAAGDNAAVPDLTARPEAAFSPPNAQNAVRQGRRLADNLAATLRGRPTRDYRHASLGVVATLGIGRGVFQYKRLTIKGLLAWLMHRGYHVLAIPTWERKVRVAAVWSTAALAGRDIVSLLSVQRPREAFLTGGRPQASSADLKRLIVSDGTPEQVRELSA